MAGVVGAVTGPDAEYTAVGAAWAPSHKVTMESVVGTYVLSLESWSIRGGARIMPLRASHRSVRPLACAIAWLRLVCSAQAKPCTRPATCRVWRRQQHGMPIATRPPRQFLHLFVGENLYMDEPVRRPAPMHGRVALYLECRDTELKPVHRASSVRHTAGSTCTHQAPGSAPIRRRLP
jgi:hypothetical protein